MGLNVANCPKCGKVFVIGIRDICPACIKEVDLMFERCTKYLRENRGSTFQQLSEATEVPVIQIFKFLREGRISVIGMPNLSYPCEVCGTEIREKNICDSCRRRLKKDASNVLQDESRAQELRRQENKVSYKISDRLNDRKK